jgi:AcrR family transcriptional regulator
VVRQEVPTDGAELGAKERHDDDLSLDRVVHAAVALLDTEGIEAFSMRALAAHLGRSTMAAYRHVQNRESLIRLAAESVQQDLPDLGSRRWYERLETIARHGWTTCWRPHPWVVDFLDSGAITPKATRRLAVMEQVFRDAGFDDAQIEYALTAHWSFVIGTLRMIVSIRTTTRRRQAPSEDAIFDFNLKTWMLGLGAMAKGIDYEVLDGQI